MRRRTLLLRLTCGALLFGSTAAEQAPPAAGGLTAVPGVKVGHHTLTARPTGCTVVLTGGRGGRRRRARRRAGHARDRSARSVNTVQLVHAIVLSGGSAFGLDAATGVMRYLEERNIGFSDSARQGADRAGGDPLRPRLRRQPEDPARRRLRLPGGARATTAGRGRQRRRRRRRDRRQARRAGRAMKAGIGSAALVLPDGLVVAALVAVNAVGDVIDPATGTGRRRRAHAGRHGPGRRATSASDRRRCRRASPARTRRSASSPPTPTLTKAQATKVAQMAHDGFARAISRPHAGRRRHDLRDGHRRSTGRPGHLAHRRRGRRRRLAGDSERHQARGRHSRISGSPGPSAVVQRPHRSQPE